MGLPVTPGFAGAPPLPAGISPTRGEKAGGVLIVQMECKGRGTVSPFSLWGGI